MLPYALNVNLVIYEVYTFLVYSFVAYNSTSIVLCTVIVRRVDIQTIGLPNYIKLP